jgi:arsenate-mycothiol transferase
MDSTSTPNLLFLCNKNGGRSQMAAAWARSLGGDAVVVTSAGASPGTSLNAYVVKVLDELGLDTSDEFPKAVTEEMIRNATVVVSLKKDLELPRIEGTRYEVWELADPDDDGLDGVRQTCEQIRVRVTELLDRLGVAQG